MDVDEWINITVQSIIYKGVLFFDLKGKRYYSDYALLVDDKAKDEMMKDIALVMVASHRIDDTDELIRIIGPCMKRIYIRINEYRIDL